MGGADCILKHIDHGSSDDAHSSWPQFTTHLVDSPASRMDLPVHKPSEESVLEILEEIQTLKPIVSKST